jgi:voltage-gated potassium channel
MLPKTIDSNEEHQLARQLALQEASVTRIQQRAHRWRLQDCDEPTLVRMRHALIEELVAMRNQLSQADDYFLQCVQAGEPIATDQALQQIDRLSAEWHTLDRHLRDVDDAIVERHIQDRMASVMGGVRNYALWDLFVLVIIIVSVIITVGELALLNQAEFSDVVTILIAVDTAICAVLLLDFFLRLWFVEDRGWYMRRYWIDLIASLPFTGALRFGRLVRLARFARTLRILRLIRAYRSLTETFRGLDKLFKTFEVILLRRSLMLAVILLFVGAFAISAFESLDSLPGNSNLQKGLWWSFTTVATGGFADIYDPTTTGGRVLTGGLVLLGFVVTGVFTASLTSVLLGDESKTVEQNLYQIEDQLSGMMGQLQLLSTQTNAALLALETVAQALSNQKSADAIARTLCTAMTESFEALQASVHLIEGTQIRRLAMAGLETVAPDYLATLGDGFLGQIGAELEREDLSHFDVEPIVQPVVSVGGVALACPLVAQGQLLGFLHIVLPENIGRYYLYNRAPMTLAHHAAIALYAIG